MSVSGSGVVLEIKGSLAVIALGKKDEKVILLTEERLESLSRALDDVQSRTEVKGLVITGPQANIFSAGADVKRIRDVTDPEVGRRLARRGQEIYAKLEGLKVRTVAAIMGACVGGGLEMAPACRFRVVASGVQTKLGLPEVKLGIIPGFGGTQRLPRLIGLPSALDLMLKGKLVSGEQAVKLGLADELVLPPTLNDLDHFNTLKKVASDIALGSSPKLRKSMSLRDRVLTSTSVGRSVVVKKTKETLSREARFYPAPVKILESAVSGLNLGLSAGYERESQLLGEMIVTPESKSLVHIFFLTEEASRLGKSARDEVKDLKLGVVGGGVMGAGIASVMLGAGNSVVLVEPFEAARGRAGDAIRKGIEANRRFSQEQKSKALGRFKLSDNLNDLADCHLVLEAIVEDQTVKQELFAKISEIVSPQAVLASNTSSLSISTLGQAISGPERFIGMHFFNPAEKMPLIEVVLAPKTNARTISIMCALSAHLGKQPVVVANQAGFIVNRLLTPYLVEAAYLLEDGVAPADIEKAALSFGLPMGPLRLLDEVGLDIAMKVSQMLEKSFGARMSGPSFIDKLVADKKLGRKSGAGFYRYGGGEPELDPNLRAVLGITKTSSLSPEAIQERLVYRLINESIRCLDEGVAGEPGKEASGQMDLASVMGMGFPPFRGGVIRFIETLGFQKALEKSQSLAEKYGERFTPAPGLSGRVTRRREIPETEVNL